MRQIMEFLLNLLFLPGKLFTKTAGESLRETLKKIVQYKRKITTDYQNATQMVAPFENMMDFMNYNARNYIAEGTNYVVTSDYRKHFYEQLEKRRNQNEEIFVEKVEESKTPLEKLKNQNLKTLFNWLHGDPPKIRINFQIKNREQIVNHLQTILKSQALLSRNVINLLDLLEKEQVVKKKLSRKVNIFQVGTEKEEQRCNIVGNRGDFGRIVQNGTKKKEDETIDALRPETLTNLEGKTSINEEDTKRRMENNTKKKENEETIDALRPEILTNTERKTSINVSDRNRIIQNVTKKKQHEEIIDALRSETLTKRIMQNVTKKKDDKETIDALKPEALTNVESKTSVNDGDRNRIMQNDTKKEGEETIDALRSETPTNVERKTLIIDGDINRKMQNLTSRKDVAGMIVALKPEALTNRIVQNVSKKKDDEEKIDALRPKTLTNIERKTSMNDGDRNRILQNDTENKEHVETIDVLRPETLTNKEKKTSINDSDRNRRMQIHPKKKKDKKIDALRPEAPKNVEKKILINDAQLIYVNKKAFDELETTIRTFKLVDRNSRKSTVSSKNLVSVVKKKSCCKLKTDLSLGNSGDHKKKFHTLVRRDKTFIKTSKSSKFVKKNY